jgi:hypothetical protein
MRPLFCRLFILTAIAAALAMPTGAHASTGFTIDGLRVRPPIGTFGGVQVGSCDLGTYTGCKILTFSVENVGSDPILIGGFEAIGSDPSTFALLPSDPGSGCDSLPLVDGFWSLQPGATCTISVAFSPIRRGLTEGELHIWYTDQFNPIAVVLLRGVGT